MRMGAPVGLQVNLYILLYHLSVLDLAFGIIERKP